MIKNLFGGFRGSENETDELERKTTSVCPKTGDELVNHFREIDGELVLVKQEKKGTKQ